MPPNVVISPAPLFTMTPGGNQTRQGIVGPAGYLFPVTLSVVFPQNFAGASLITPNNRVPPYVADITLSAFSTTAPGSYVGGYVKAEGPDGFTLTYFLIVVEPVLYKTRWRDARISDQEPALGFCLTHHDPPPARTLIGPDKPVIVFGFLEWQDTAGVWHGDWPYGVSATLSITGPVNKSQTRPVGTGKGECWVNLGTVTAGSYTYTLEFAGDAQFEDGVTMKALQVGELGVSEVLLASLPLVAVLVIIGAQELNKMAH